MLRAREVATVGGLHVRFYHPAQPGMLDRALCAASLAGWRAAVTIRGHPALIGRLVVLGPEGARLGRSTETVFDLPARR